MEPESDSNSDVMRVKDMLNRNKVKLWLDPFYSEEEGRNDEDMRNLANNYSSELSLPFEACLECLYKLQSKALDNLKERMNYKNTGIAVLKIRLPSVHGQGKILTVTLDLTKSGSELKEIVASELSVTKERLKLIFEGKIIKDEETLNLQGVKHCSHIMAINLQCSSDVKKSKSHMELLNSTKADIKLLAASEMDDDYLQIADQSGKLLDLPEKDKKALILAMTLHEKGRIAMKNEDFSLALVMLLEAEKEFNYCNPSLLKKVDNYGILNLDIAWCYLNLQCVTDLPDAEQRLNCCESNFIESYGPNLERLIVLKGSAGNENALFMRLHLLQAIVLYHQNKFRQAKELLNKAEQELKYLEIDDAQLAQLIELGYPTAEARLALRQSRGDINSAVDIIEKKRQARKKNEEEEKRERAVKRAKKKLGKCINNEWIDPEFHKALMAMGYEYETARWALAQSCNNMCNSISLIQDHPDLIPKSSTEITNKLIEQVANVGFDSEMAKLALKKHNGDADKAIEELISNDGKVVDFVDSSSESECSEPSTSKAKNEAYSRVSEGISKFEDDYLDINLIAEMNFLQKYKELLSRQ